MKQNNRKNNWKAFVAVILVMVTLFTISTAVSADFVDTVFEKVCEVMTTSSNNSGHVHTRECFVTIDIRCKNPNYAPKCSNGVEGCPGGNCLIDRYYVLDCTEGSGNSDT